MKKIFVTGDDLLIKLAMSPIHEVNVKKSSFAIDVNFLEEGKEREGKLILHTREILFSDGNGNTILSVAGTIMIGEKETRLFSGICNCGEGYEDCYLLVMEDPQIFEIDISKQEFISLAKKYCESRSITVNEDGNISGDGFPLFQNLPKHAGVPAAMLRLKSLNNMEIYTILHQDFFPIMYKRKTDKAPETYFGKFISEHKIKTYTADEVRLLGIRTLFA